MKFRKHRHKFRLPEWIEATTCKLVVFPNGNPKNNPGSCGYVLHMISYEDLRDMQLRNQKYFGTPAYFCITCGSGVQEIHVYPPPSADLFALFRYCPAMKEV